MKSLTSEELKTLEKINAWEGEGFSPELTPVLVKKYLSFILYLANSLNDMQLKTKNLVTLLRKAMGILPKSERGVPLEKK